MKITMARAFIAGCFTLALGSVACSDDKTTPTDTSTTDTTTVTDTTATTDATTADTSTDTSEDTAPPTNMCNNTDDGTIIQTKTGTADDPATVAKNCGLACLGTGDGSDDALRSCAADCVKNGKGAITGIGLSVGCSGCFADVVICSKNYCFADCVTGTAEACATCRGTLHSDDGQTVTCTDAFYDCSGLPQN